MENSLNWPAVVTRPILSAPASANHSAPSGPVAISCAKAPAVGIVNSVPNCPAVVMLPILLPAISVNHSAPSGPAVMPPGLPCHENSVMAPVEVILPIALPRTSVNQGFPSDPNAIENGPASSVGSGNSMVVASIPVGAAQDDPPFEGKPMMSAFPFPLMSASARG